jgi:uncharacterized protein (DUF983 family)
LTAILLGRCPRCREGRIFSGRFAMNNLCPICGLRLEREQGYFFGALYVSYPISIAVIGLFLLVAHLLLPHVDLFGLTFVAAILYAPLMPAVFRYSRVLWIHFDRWAAPGTSSDSEAWEKWCQKREAEGRPPTN